MADKKKKSASKVTTRVVATDDPISEKKPRSTSAVKAEAVEQKQGKPKKVKKLKSKEPRDNYFIGAWYELRQVRWPDRRATWGMTFAVIVFTLFFFVLVIVLDAGFKYLFDLIVKG